jgi:uncharacterized protein (DUF608 family)
MNEKATKPLNVNNNSCCGDTDDCCQPPGIGRRGFIKATGATSLTAVMLLADPSNVMAGPFAEQEIDHVIPADKKLSKEWIESLYARGEALTATGDDLKFIGMPISGICTGQVYLGGDGKLWYWNLDANKDKKNNPKGPRYMTPDPTPAPKEARQGFAIKVNDKVHNLDNTGFKDVRFTNQYPMGRVNYVDEACPVEVQLTAYTPFIPLNRDESSYPVIVMRYTLTNTDSTATDVSIAGWIENISNRKSGKPKNLKGKSQKLAVYQEHENLSTVECSAKFQNKAMKSQPDHCSIALGVLGNERPELVDIAKDSPGPNGVFSSEIAVKAGDRNLSNFPRSAYASLGRKLTLQPGESKTISFAVSWCFPLVKYGVNFGPKGVTLGKNHYATVFPTAASASGQLASRETELFDGTKAWTDTWYDSTLPYWFLERTFIPINCVQTQLGQRVFPKGSETEIYNFEEGVRCCPGNCTHVWHYAQGLARIFPVIERENRDKVEYGLGFTKESGDIAHRYVDRKRFGDAIDGNCGTILRVLRESQMTTDYTFLESIWDRVKLSMDHVIKKWDADEDGMLEGAQHNTLDEPWFGQVHWLINLYHAALKASAVMARQMKQPAVADRYEAIVAKGMPAMVDLLWNEEFGYFIHKPGDPDNQKHGSTNGCHIDQVLGDSWLYNVGIGPTLPQDKIKSSLEALWKFNFTPNVGAFRKLMKNGRFYAAGGDAGLVMCSFPNGKIEPKSGKASYAGYLNECMTGFEWQVAAHMIWEGMLEKGLAIGKAIYDRYQPSARNPYNEIECSDHYSRAMASYGAFMAACGYRYDGPAGKLAFGPRLQPENFRAAFTTAEGWGSFTQTVESGKQTAGLDLRYGKLSLNEFSLDVVNGIAANGADAKLDGEQIEIAFAKEANRFVIRFATPVTIEAGHQLQIELR